MNFYNTVLWVKNQDEVNLFEQIAFAYWEYLTMKEEIFDVYYIKNLHKKMFKPIHTFAWNFRNVEVIFGDREGVPSNEIFQQMKILCDDVNFQKENKVDLISIVSEFQKRFVLIHPFNDTNGRMSRLLSKKFIDDKIQKVDCYKYIWGRKEYLKAISEDKWDFEKLIENFIENGFEEWKRIFTWEETISLIEFLCCLEKAYWNCRLEAQEFEYIWVEKELVEFFEKHWKVNVLIWERWFEEDLKWFYENFKIQH